MGQQISQHGTVVAQQSSPIPWTGKISPKTHFYYVHPIKCQLEDHVQLEEESIQELNKNTHEAEYWEIQNNQEEPTVNSIKDLEKIQQIKVRWNEFIKMKKRNYLQDYSVLKEIGRGGFGCVHKVKARYTGLYRAAKRIKKAQLNKAEHEKLFQEMAIMISLDHPNIAKLYEVYDYKSHYVLILELCEGGELFKKIVTKQLTEESSAHIMKQILWTLIYLHKKGIVHRDLKPENMLFQQDSDIVKIIDFGIAVKKKPNEVLTARLGTPYYIAPEVLCKSYGQKCDIWSAGVILYMMISGFPPFRGESQYDVMESVLKESAAFKGNIWNRVTTQCKNLIAWMLKKNPDQRPTAEQAFNHPWIKKVVEKVPQLNKQQLVIANIRDFSFQNKLQAVVYTYIVSQLLTSEEKNLLFQTFKELDKNNDGVIESSELFQALKGKKDISEERVKFLMRVIDTNGSGHIDYTEFLVAGIDPRKCLTEHHFQLAFQYFDIDHSGAITFEEIAHFLQDTKESEQSIKKIFQQVDENNDGNISKEEFVKLLMEETKKKLTVYASMKDLDDQNLKKDREKQAKNQNPASKNRKTSQKTQKLFKPTQGEATKSEKENKTPAVPAVKKNEPIKVKSETEKKKTQETSKPIPDKVVQKQKPVTALKNKQMGSAREGKSNKKVTIIA